MRMCSAISSPARTKWWHAAILSIIVASVAGTLMSAHGTGAATAGFSVYIDTTADGTAGAIETASSFTPPATQKVEIEVQNVPNGGMDGYNITLNWSPAGNLSTTSAQIVDKTGFAPVFKSVGAGTLTFASESLDDPTCTVPVPGGAGATSAVLFEVEFTGVSNGLTNLTFDPTLAEIGFCDATTAAPDHLDAGSLAVPGADVPPLTPSAAAQASPAPTATGATPACVVGQLACTPTPLPSGEQAITPAPSNPNPSNAAATSTPGGSAPTVAPGGSPTAGRVPPGGSPTSGQVPPGTSASSGWGAWQYAVIAIAVLVVLAIAVGGWLWMRRARQP